MKNQHQDKQEWEKEFEEGFSVPSDPTSKDLGRFYTEGSPNIWMLDKDKIKAFISRLLAQQREEMGKEIEGMKKRRLDCPRSLGDGDIVNQAPGYNQALDDVLAKLVVKKDHE